MGHNTAQDIACQHAAEGFRRADGQAQVGDVVRRHVGAGPSGVRLVSRAEDNHELFLGLAPGPGDGVLVACLYGGHHIVNHRLIPGPILDREVIGFPQQALPQFFLLRLAVQPLPIHPAIDPHPLCLALAG